MNYFTLVPYRYHVENERKNFEFGNLHLDDTKRVFAQWMFSFPQHYLELNAQISENEKINYKQNHTQCTICSKFEQWKNSNGTVLKEWCQMQIVWRIDCPQYFLNFLWFRYSNEIFTKDSITMNNQCSKFYTGEMMSSK